jgi:MFS family permease
VAGRYRSLLALPGVARLLLSSLAGRLPLGMASLSILLLLRAATHSFALAGACVGAFAISEAAMSPVIGTLIDRVGMTAVLVPSAATQAVLLVVLALVAGPSVSRLLLAGLSAAAGASMPPVAACIRMLWPRVTPDRGMRDAAYALDATSQEIVWTAGPLLAGLLAGAISPRAAVLAVAGVSVTGTALFASSPHTRRCAAADAGERAGGALASAALRRLLAADVLLGLSMGAVEVGLPALAIRDGHRTAAGLLLAVWSLGSMIGGLCYGARSWPMPLGRRFGVLLLLTAAVTGPLVFASGLAMSFALAALAGVTGAPVFSCLYSLVGDHAPVGAAGAAFTWNTAALVSGIAGGSAIAGVAVSAIGVSAAFGLAVSFVLIAAGVALVSAPGWDRVPVLSGQR